MPPRKRKRYTFFLRPNAAAELARMLVGLESVVERLSVDLSDEGLSIEGLDSCQICMVFFRAPASAFKTFEVETPTHLDLDAGVVKRVFRSNTTDFLFYQEASEPDKVVFEKIDAGVKLTIGLIDAEPDRRVIPAYTVTARHSHETGRELTKSLEDLIATLQAGDDDAAEFEAITTSKGPKWFVRHGGSTVRLSQSLKKGTNEVRVSETLKVSGRYIVTFMQLAAIAKGPTELRFVKLAGSATLFAVHAEAADRDFGFDLFLAPKIEE